MSRWSLAFLPVLFGAPAALAQASIPLPRHGLCRSAIAAVERATFVPDRLMQAIAVVESGRRDAQGETTPWPWTINVEGQGEMFDSKAEAITAVRAHQARGARSIDVGCMQVNLQHHPDAFASLDEAFDPAANARYAARFLQRLLAQTGSWPRAVAAYHSMTPEIGGEYARKVLAVWARPDLQRSGDAPRPGNPGIANPGFEPGSTNPVAALPTGMPARVQAIPAASAAAPTGRGLDAYRAAPTRLAVSLPWRKS